MRLEMTDVPPTTVEHGHVGVGDVGVIFPGKNFGAL